MRTRFMNEGDDTITGDYSCSCNSGMMYCRGKMIFHINPSFVVTVYHWNSQRRDQCVIDETELRRLQFLLSINFFSFQPEISHVATWLQERLLTWTRKS